MADIRVLPPSRPHLARNSEEILEETLQEVRDGDIAQVAIALVRPDGSLDAYWVETDEAAKLLGAVALLQYRLVAEVDG